MDRNLDVEVDAEVEVEVEVEVGMTGLLDTGVFLSKTFFIVETKDENEKEEKVEKEKKEDLGEEGRGGIIVISIIPFFTTSSLLFVFVFVFSILCAISILNDSEVSKATKLQEKNVPSEGASNKEFSLFI